MRRGRTTPQDSAFSSPTPAPTPGMTLLTLFSLLARNLGVYVFRKIIRRHCFTVYTCYRPVQPRSYVLRFEGHNIFLGGNIFVLLHVRTNYFINFQRLTGQHIASCLFSVWSHTICVCTGMLRAVVSQVGRRTPVPFSNFWKRWPFPEKVSYQN